MLHSSIYILHLHTLKWRHWRKKRGQNVIHVCIYGRKGMCPVNHHGAAGVFSGNKHVAVSKQGNHLVRGNLKGFVLGSCGHIEPKILLGKALLLYGIIEDLRGQIAVPNAVDSALAVILKLR